MEPSTSPFERINLVVVSRKAPRLVPPARETPRATFIVPAVDEAAGFGPIMSSHVLLFEGHHRHPTASIWNSIANGLAEVLCSYYPFAGRLKAPAGGPRAERRKLELVCNGLGAVFFEAQANISLAQLKKLDKVYWAELHKDGVGEASIEMCPLVVQVTSLTCGGFVLSISVLQSLCDSAGMLHFLYAWSEMTRLAPGQNIAVTEPIWGGMIPLQFPQWPQKFHFPSLEAITPGPTHHKPADDDHHRLQYVDARDSAYHGKAQWGGGPDSSMEGRDQSSYDGMLGLSNISISLDFLHHLKDHILINCNRFEALAALFWRERTRALALPKMSEAVLFFPAPVPHDVHLAFYGQYGFNCMVSMQVGELIKSELTEIVRKMQHAKAMVASGFGECMRRFAQLHVKASKRAPAQVLLFTVLWHGVEEIDFGSGSPPYAPDATRLPSPVNLAVVTGAQDEETIEVVMTNTPTGFSDNIHFHMLPATRRPLSSDSKL